MRTTSKYLLFGLLVSGVVCTAGCRSKFWGPEPTAATRSDSWETRRNFDTQADNAVLTSMSVADVHFLPYRAELNSLGRARLAAIAKYLDEHGGEVTVDSRQQDEVLREERLETVRRFLSAQVLEPERLTIVTGLSRGRGEDATEAALFYEANLVPEESSATSSTSAAAPAPAASGAGSSQ